MTGMLTASELGLGCQAVNGAGRPCKYAIGSHSMHVDETGLAWSDQDVPTARDTVAESMAVYREACRDALATDAAVEEAKHALARAHADQKAAHEHKDERGRALLAEVSK